MKFISAKTENIKNVFGLEDKVKKEMDPKTSNKKKVIPKKTNIFRKDEDDSNQEIVDKMKNKKLPENVKAEIEKEMKRQGGESERAVTLKYI